MSTVLLNTTTKAQTNNKRQRNTPKVIKLPNWDLESTKEPFVNNNLTAKLQKKRKDYVIMHRSIKHLWETCSLLKKKKSS